VQFLHIGKIQSATTHQVSLRAAGCAPPSGTGKVKVSKK